MKLLELLKSGAPFHKQPSATKKGPGRFHKNGHKKAK